MIPLFVVVWTFRGGREYVLQSCAGDADIAPGGHARVAVLADDVAACNMPSYPRIPTKLVVDLFSGPGHNYCSIRTFIAKIKCIKVRALF